MLDAAYADYAVPAGANWRDVMRAHAEQTRAVGLRHPWLREISARQVILLTPRLMAANETALASLDGLGLDTDTMMAVCQAVTAYAHGALGAEVGQLDLMKRQQWSSGEDLRDAYSPHMTWLMDTGRYPVYRRWTEQADRKDDFAWRFDFGLDCLLDGIAARLGL
jgi:hypothetical protein